MITRESREQFEKILLEGELYIAGEGGITEPEDESFYCFQKGRDSQIDLLFD